MPDIEGDTLVVRLDKKDFRWPVEQLFQCNTREKSCAEAMNVPPIVARCAVRVSLWGG
ncbi:MAG: hypothetical protein P0107_00045 [Nitrosomonas sp.]|nr:hypothetical protein [Nitrosomonas sp.]